MLQKFHNYMTQVHILTIFVLTAVIVTTVVDIVAGVAGSAGGAAINKPNPKQCRCYCCQWLKILLRAATTIAAVITSAADTAVVTNYYLYNFPSDITAVRVVAIDQIFVRTLRGFLRCNLKKLLN